MKFLDIPTLAERAQYEEYMERIKIAYPKKLFNTYVKTWRFHDCYIFDISYRADTTYLKVKSDQLVLTLLIDTDVNQYLLKIEFDRIKSIKFDSHGMDIAEIWEDGLCPPELIEKMKAKRAASTELENLKIGRIYYAELGVTERNDFTFEFVTEKGFMLHVTFQKCEIEKKKIWF